MKVYMFGLSVCHRRTCEKISTTLGVVFADNEKDARDKAWAMCGSDLTCELWVREVPEEGTSFTVYRGAL